ncbi:hypothetical protein BX616_001244, partial [Lobosporangium transversale]
MVPGDIHVKLKAQKLVINNDQNVKATPRYLKHAGQRVIKTHINTAYAGGPPRFKHEEKSRMSI